MEVQDCDCGWVGGRPGEGGAGKYYESFSSRKLDDDQDLLEDMTRAYPSEAEGESLANANT